jgi:hypothetical protein
LAIEISIAGVVKLVDAEDSKSTIWKATEAGNYYKFQFFQKLIKNSNHRFFTLQILSPAGWIHQGS